MHRFSLSLSLSLSLSPEIKQILEKKYYIVKDKIYFSSSCHVNRSCHKDKERCVASIISTDL
jgi:adenylosuccinate synthase